MSQTQPVPANTGEFGNFNSCPIHAFMTDVLQTMVGCRNLPNPLTKITWDNVALISPTTAKRLGINQNEDYNDYAGGELGTTFINTKGGNLFSDLVTLNYQGGQIEKRVPMWIAPGQPDDVITIYMGYGRTREPEESEPDLRLQRF